MIEESITFMTMCCIYLIFNIFFLKACNIKENMSPIFKVQKIRI